MLFYLYLILFASALAQAAPTESTIMDLKGPIEEMTTLRPSITNESSINSTTDGSISTVIPETTTSAPTTEIEISSTTTPSTNDEISTLTPEITTESFFLSTTPNELTSDGITTTLTPETTTESSFISTTPIELTSDGITTTLIPEMITDASTTESEISSTITPSTNDEISTLTPETTTESFFLSTTPNELTSDGITTTLIPEMITDAPTTESSFVSTTSNELTTDSITTTLAPEIITESFFISTTPIESTTDSATTTLKSEMITDAPTTETEISSTITTKDEIGSLTPETTTESFSVSTTPNELIEDSTTTTLTPEITTESFIASTTPFESITDDVFSTLTPESFPPLTTPIVSTTGAPTSAFEAINTTRNPATIGVLSTSTEETPTTEETAEHNNESTDTAHIFQFVLKHETPEYCNWYRINCRSCLNNQSSCTYSLVGDCNNFKAYQIWPIKQLDRPFTYIPYTFKYQYVHKEQRSYGCNLYRVKCQHYYFVNVKTEHCNQEYVSECSNYQMIHVINSSFY